MRPRMHTKKIPCRDSACAVKRSSGGGRGQWAPQVHWHPLHPAGHVPDDKFIVSILFISYNHHFCIDILDPLWFFWRLPSITNFYNVKIKLYSSNNTYSVDWQGHWENDDPPSCHCIMSQTGSSVRVAIAPIKRRPSSRHAQSCYGAWIRFQWNSAACVARGAFAIRCVRAAPAIDRSRTRLSFCCYGWIKNYTSRIWSTSVSGISMPRIFQNGRAFFFSV